MDLHLEDQRVGITGASKGIGAAIAESFAEEGSDLHLIARGREQLVSLAAQLRARHKVNVQTHVIDLRSSQAASDLASELPDIDVLVNNAGDIPAGSLMAVDESRWRRAGNSKSSGTHKPVPDRF